MINDVLVSGFFELAAVSASLSAAHETGLLVALSTGPASGTELAERCTCSVAAAEQVLAVLVEAGVVQVDGDRYRFTSAVQSELDKSPGGAPAYFRLWAHTPTYLRSGAPTAVMDGTPAERSAAYSSTVGGLADLFGDAALTLASFAPIRAGARVLDLGAGSGVWSLAMISATPDATATAVDFERVLPSFRARAAIVGVGDRAETIVGDYHEVALDRNRYDRIVLANVLHLESPTDAAALISKAASATASDGDLVIVDIFDGDRPARLRHAAYALHLGMRSAAARPHRIADLVGWLAEAGFDRYSSIDLGAPAGVSALVARRGVV